VSTNAVATLPDLDRIAGHVHAAQRAARAAHYLLTNPENRDDLPDPAPQVNEAGDETSAALRLMATLGARRLALPVAERIDRARGRALPPNFPLAEGETAGCDLAETLGYVALRLETEIHGPADLRQNGAGER